MQIPVLLAIVACLWLGPACILMAVDAGPGEKLKTAWNTLVSQLRFYAMLALVILPFSALGALGQLNRHHGSLLQALALLAITAGLAAVLWLCCRQRPLRHPGRS